MKKIVIVLIAAALLTGCTQKEQAADNPIHTEIVEETNTLTPEPEATQEPKEEVEIYLHIEAPTDEAQLFLPGIVSTAHFEHSALAIVDENTLMWSRFDQPISADSIHNIMISTYNGTQWSEPKVVDWSNESTEDSPFYYDGQVFFHLKVETFKLAYYDLAEKSQTIIDIPNVESGLSCPSRFENMLIFDMAIDQRPDSIISYSVYENGYSEPIPLLSDEDNRFLNFNPFISSDGQVLLYSSVSRPDGKGAADLFVSFKNPDGGWSQGIALKQINTRSNERFPSLSPDGQYLFFVSNRAVSANLRSDTLPQNGLGDIYWIDASFIYELNPYK